MSLVKMSKCNWVAVRQRKTQSGWRGPDADSEMGNFRPTTGAEQQWETDTQLWARPRLWHSWYFSALCAKWTLSFDWNVKGDLTAVWFALEEYWIQTWRKWGVLVLGVSQAEGPAHRVHLVCRGASRRRPWGRSKGGWAGTGEMPGR